MDWYRTVTDERHVAGVSFLFSWACFTVLGKVNAVLWITVHGCLPLLVQAILDQLGTKGISIHTATYSGINYCTLLIDSTPLEVL